MKHHTNRIVSCLCALVLIGRSSAIALNEPTHQIINEEATRQSGLHQFLKDLFKSDEGIQQSMHGRRVIEWVGEGGVREDDGFRFFNHFHDPLRPWSDSGLSSSFDPNKSSVRWMQDSGSGWSWQSAREYYWTALTSTTQSAREKAFADTFRALGQVMHLVVDASVPEHVRNDPHPLEGLCRMVGVRCMGNYEYWVSDAHGRPGSIEENNFISRYLTNTMGFDSSILQQPTNDSAAPVTVARLIDTDTYTGAGSGPNVTLSPAIGIGEFANANFFSEDTIYGSYPYPNVRALVPSQVESPTTIFKYYAKGTGDGAPNNFAAAECILDQAAIDQGIFSGPTYLCVDEMVWSSTAQAMLPRAVGYARGTLDYFFRGRINTFPSAVEDYLWTQWDQRPNSIRVDGVSVSVDSGNEQGGQGTMHLVLRLRGTDVDPASESIPPVVVSHPVSVSASSTPQTVVFPFDALPFPQTFPELGTFSAEYWASIVYRGPLGQEADAVAVGGHCFDPTDGSKYNWRYDFEHLHGYNPFEGGGGPDVHIAYIAWC